MRWGYSRLTMALYIVREGGDNVTVSAFLNAVQTIANRIKYYKANSGGLTPDGGCDCIGLVKEAYVLAGGRWACGTGTNAAARNMMQSLTPIASTQLKPGMVVYKYRAPGEPYWDLPDTYRHDANQNDYYHIGVVMTTGPLQIIHCTTVDGGVKIDNTVGNWKVCGFLKGVDGGMNPITPQEGWVAVDYARVIYATNGGNVNMRSGPGKNYSVVKQLKVGTEVEVRYECDANWAQIHVDGQDGFVMREFLAVPKSTGINNTFTPEQEQPSKTEPSWTEKPNVGQTEQPIKTDVEMLAYIRETLSILIMQIDEKLHG